jgi:glycine hydroxymethyltransferase
VIANASAMADEFRSLGYRIISGGTDNHLMLIDLAHRGVTGKVAEEALSRAEITVNKNMVPFDPNPATVTGGIRVGTPAMSTRGLGVAEFRRIARLMDQVLSKPACADTAAKVKGEVLEICRSFPLYAR